ncbi:MAG: D-alanine--D-alanine ligase, partial [bacterium]|nr:D-alanine--D-alanine ligase [bacterium]
MIKVGVVRGGPSSEYDVSLKTGGEVLKHLPSRYKGYDVLVTKDGQWHLNGFSAEPARIFEKIDVFFNALHGEYGEDGRVQQVFESFNAPYTGSEIIPSVLAMKKHRANELFNRAGMRTPRSLVFKRGDLIFESTEDIASKVFSSMPPLWVVKPASLGSSVGVSICKSFTELIEGIEKAFSGDSTILVEEFIKGREATCGVLESFRGQYVYAFPPVEIVPPEEHFFDYEVKYNGSTREICPAGFEHSIKREIENLAKKAHQILGCRHYSRTDFIISKRGIYVLEINTLPGLTSQSL